MIFSLELEIFGVAVQRIHQNSENWWLCEELLNENDIEAVLVTFCCYHYGASASEAVQKITIDQKDYRRFSSCVIAYSIAITINNSEKRLVAYYDTSAVAKKTAEVAQKKEQ